VSERITLYTKPGCHLCDVAREVIEIVCAEQDTDFVEINIWDDPADADRFAERIPVITVDGVEVAHFRIDPDRLRAALGAA
jgi:glutaredoxin